MRESQGPIFLCFLNFEKAFDRVMHDKLFQLLDTLGLHTAGKLIIRNPNSKQNSIILLENGETSEPVSIEQGVRQGCILFPMLFNIYAEQSSKEALTDREEGVKTGDENYIRYLSR